MSVRRLSLIERGIDKPKDDEGDRLARAMPVRCLNPQPTGTHTRAV
jgi:hypothetical protein